MWCGFPLPVRRGNVMFNNRSYLPGNSSQSHYRARVPGQSYGSRYKQRYGSTRVSQNRVDQSESMEQTQASSTVEVAVQVANKKTQAVAA